MHELTRFQMDILTIVAGEDKPYGLGIKSKLEDYYGDDINHGRLYPNLDELVEKGLLEKGELDRRTNFYEVTEEGKQVLQDRQQWFNETAAPVLA